jgi:hypothetical protein
VIGVVAALLLVLAAPVAADETDAFMRPCRRADLLGLWQVVRVGRIAGSVVDPADREQQPHQRYVFHANATMRYASSPLPFTAEDDRRLLAEPASVTWALGPDGRLLRQREGAPRAEASTCRVLTRPVKDPKNPLRALPGDVLLTDLGEDERPTVRRLLRRLSRAD